MKGRLAYAINNGLTAGVTITYDNAFETRVSGDITYRFNTPKTTVPSIGNNDLIAALSKPLPNRDVRVLARALTQAAGPQLAVCNWGNEINRNESKPIGEWDTTGFGVLPGFTGLVNIQSKSYLKTIGTNYICTLYVPQ